MQPATFYATTLRLAVGDRQVVGQFEPTPGGPLPVAATTAPILDDTGTLLGFSLRIGHNSAALHDWIDNVVRDALSPLDIQLWATVPLARGKSFHVRYPVVTDIQGTSHSTTPSRPPTRWYYLFGTAGFDSTDIAHSMAIGPVEPPAPDLTIPATPNPPDPKDTDG